MKTMEEIGEELQKQRRLVWYIDWLQWNRTNPIDSMSASTVKEIYRPALEFADTIDHYYKDEMDTFRLADAAEKERSKLLGQCVALAWVLGIALHDTEKHCGPGPNEPLPALPGVWEPEH